MKPLQILPIRQPKVKSDFPPQHYTQGFEYTNRIGETVKADGWNNLFGVFKKGKRVKTISYDEAKSEYDYEISLRSK